MMQLNSSARQPFDAVIQTRKIDLRSYRVRGQTSCPPILSLLIIGTCIGLFAYVNTFFIVKIANLIDGSIFSKTTDTFSCDQYFCDETAYNFINYYSNYLKCNTANCQNIICSNYICGNSQYQSDINYYYACQPKCGPLVNTAPPPIVQAAYIMSIVAACTFGLGILLGILYGIIASLCSSSLTVLERIAIFITFVWPKLKYYAFRRRHNWEDFDFNLKGMVIMDMVINLCYAVTLALYIALESNSMWQTGPQIACFYMLIWATITRATMVG